MQSFLNICRGGYNKIKVSSLVDLFPEIKGIENQLCTESWYEMVKCFLIIRRLESLLFFDDAVLNNKFTWAEISSIGDFEYLDCDSEPRENLAKLLVDSNLKDGGEGPVLIIFNLIGQDFIRVMLDELESKKIDFDVFCKDSDWQKRLFKEPSVDQIKVLAESVVKTYSGFNQMIRIESYGGRGVDSSISKEKKEAYLQAVSPIKVRLRNGNLFYTLTVLPTKADAELDQMDYEEYLELFFESCNQPWEELKSAQSVLIESLNSAKKLRFVNSDGTDVKMSIDGFTFANSVVAKNVPGSEVFSAPEKFSIEGKVVAKGRFFNDFVGEVLEDIWLTFVNGEIVDGGARVGDTAFKDFLLAEKESRYIGEIGIGTNPHLRQHLVNGLLVEKVSGSFHLALGNAYTYTSYCGDEVRLDNGNRSERGVHWDLTTLLKGKDGEMYLDDVLIQKDGLFLGEELAVLNYGWGAVSASKQPKWWREKFPNGYYA